MAKLTVNAGHIQIRSATTPTGSGIPRNESTATHVVLRNELTIAEGTVGFHVVVNVPRPFAQETDSAELLAIAWVAQELPVYLSSHPYWDFFQAREINVEAPIQTLNINKHRPCSFDIEPDPGLLQRTQEMLQYLEQVKARFDEAKSKLSRFALHNQPPGYQHTRGEAYAHFRTIEDILDAGADIGAYRAQDARSAQREYDELASRVDTKRPAYRMARDSLLRFVLRVEFPSTWHERPRA
ncbi:hypothetical protein EIP75_21780 [Aquabacterium soli]|uniref:Uncharacterized protein n=1 Tax=Aquabacterium soli TaxID=2493092 RepID=A0A3R8RZY1_9BURK|nr:hypothetical protein [Aquabacterium soli]RRS01104.1 hypothetical protein EIP75_21780 [Aquabacterium soli]